MLQTVEKKITLEESRWFAEVSGDFNPIHIDPLFARRTPYGRCIAHGVYLIILSLNELYYVNNTLIKIKSLKASFNKAVCLDEPFLIKITNESNLIKLKILVNGGIVTEIEVLPDINFETYAPLMSSKLSNLNRIPEMLSSEHIEINFRLSEEKFIESDKFVRKFENLNSNLSLELVTVLNAISRVVGMKMPGLNSLLSSIEIISEEKKSENSKELHFEVSSFDKRFGLLEIGMRSDSYNSIIECFLRKGIIDQLSFSEISNQVNADEFKNQKALVIGGTRGLGEITVKILSAGGATCFFTYNLGIQDAQRLEKEIEKETVKSFFLNILDEKSFSILANLNITDLYFMPTPAIFVGDSESLIKNHFDTFVDYYVFSFFKLVKALKKIGLQRVFYPSTIALSELPSDMKEYCLAKLCGELLCQFLSADEEIKVFYPRISRLNTDQTASVFPVKNADTFKEMLTLVKEFDKL